MRKHILTRLKSVFRATPVASKPVDDSQTIPDNDQWLFDADTAIEATRRELSRDMNSIAESLTDLRETLAFIHGETPLPQEVRTDTPCAIIHHDDVIFEGEVESPFIPAQEEVSGGDGMFLFGDAPTFQDELPAHQHAA